MGANDSLSRSREVSVGGLGYAQGITAYPFSYFGSKTEKARDDCCRTVRQLRVPRKEGENRPHTRERGMEKHTKF